MFCLTGHYSQVPGLRLRPVRELGVCVVFAPAAARLYRLNAQTWFVLALCKQGLSGDALREAWRETVAPESPTLEGEAAQKLSVAVRLLLDAALLRREPAVAEAGQGSTATGAG